MNTLQQIVDIGRVFDDYSAGRLTSFQLFVAIREADLNEAQWLAIRNAANDVERSTDGVYFTNDFDMAGLLKQVTTPTQENLWLHSVNQVRAHITLEREGIAA